MRQHRFWGRCLQLLLQQLGSCRPSTAASQVVNVVPAGRMARSGSDQCGDSDDGGVWAYGYPTHLGLTVTGTGTEPAPLACVAGMRCSLVPRFT
jgi:hypothetical protein